MAVTPLSPLTCTGVLLSVFVPLPNCPSAFNPQADTVPSARADWHKQNTAMMEHAIFRRRCMLVSPSFYPGFLFRLSGRYAQRTPFGSRQGNSFIFISALEIHYAQYTASLFVPGAGGAPFHT